MDKTDLYYELKYAVPEMLNKENLERIKDTISVFPKDIDSVIDIGCGKAGILEFLQSKRTLNRVVVLDRSFNAVRDVKFNKVLASVENIPFPDKSFDLVLCSELLEHLPADMFPQVLLELQRIAKKYILISVPYNENLRNGFIRCPLCRHEFHRYRHLRAFKKKDIAVLFKGFKLVKLELSSFEKRIFFLSFINKTIRRFFQSATFSEHELCPQCGYHRGKAGVRSVATSSAILKRLGRKLLLSLPYRNKYHWLIALFQRGDQI